MKKWIINSIAVTVLIVFLTFLYWPDKSTKTVADINIIKIENVPFCPYCKVPTDRVILGGTTTLLYDPIILKSDGTIDQHNSNRTTTTYKCLKCGKQYDVSNQ